MVAAQEILTGAFDLIGEDVSRVDLAVRRETKCLLPNGDVGKFRKLLEGNARRLIHNEPVSTVRSIYFDDVRLSDCHANLDGISPRRKVRLRWYDSLTPEVLFFEVNGVFEATRCDKVWGRRGRIGRAFMNPTFYSSYS